MAVQQLLDPEILTRLSNIEVVARTVVNGFLTGLHRSPFFGFSQEFAEYRPYVQGDDPRFIDWNVLSRSNRTYVKRFLGETNTHLVLLVDASASMGYQSGAVSKLDYAKFLAASLAYLSTRQHDAVGLMLFDETIREMRPPMFRPGHLQSILHVLQNAEPATGTNLEIPFHEFQRHVSRKGLAAMISDFFVDPRQVVDAVRPLVFHGQDIVFFQVLDPREMAPQLGSSAVLEDMETGESMQVSPDFANREYPARIRAHIERMRDTVEAEGADYVLMNTAQPLDLALREFLLFRQRRR